MNRKEKTEKFALNSILFLIVFFLLAFTLSSYAQLIDTSKKLENKIVRSYKVKESFKKFYKDVFKYSTIYGSYSESSPLFTPESYFVTQLGDVVDVSPERENDYAISIGLRKIARMDYENRENRFYDGTEQNASLQSNIGNVKGLEYLFQYSQGRQRGRDFESQRYLVRYIAKWWMAKGEIQQNGLINLDYKSADLRFRVPLFKKFSLSIGGALRTHLPYGYNPIDDYLSQNNWWELAYDYGFQDIGYSIDYDYDGGRR